MPSYWAENTRGRVLSELLSRRHAGENYKIPSKLANEEDELTTAIMINKKAAANCLPEEQS